MEDPWYGQSVQNLHPVSGGYRNKFLARDKEMRRYELRIEEMERDRRYSQGKATTSQLQTIRTTSFILRDWQMRLEALAEVLISVDGSTSDRVHLSSGLSTKS